MSVSLLELRYRSLLRLLPAGYRARWEDDMVATLLDGLPADLDPDEARLGRSEIGSVLVLAVRLRVGRLGAGGTPRSQLWADAVRLVAVIGLLVQAALAGMSMIGWAIGSGRLARFVAPPDGPPFRESWPQLLWDSKIVWVGAYLALVLGQRWVARALASVVVVPLVYRSATSLGFLLGVQAPEAHRVAGLLGNLALAVVPVLTMFVGYQRGMSAPRQAGRWLAALPVAVAVVTVAPLLLWNVSHLLAVDQDALQCLTLVVAGAVYLAARRPGAEPAGALALALLGSVVLVCRATSAVDYWSLDAGTQRSWLQAESIGELAAAVVVTVLLAVVAGRALRRLPAGPVADGVLAP